jgi:hypothetical protein
MQCADNPMPPADLLMTAHSFKCIIYALYAVLFHANQKTAAELQKPKRSAFRYI